MNTSPNPSARSAGRGLRLFGLLLFALALAGCGSPLIRSGSVVKIEDFSVQATQDWSQIGSGRQRSWTLDGLALNRLMLLSGIKDREHVFLATRTRQMRKGEGALFRAGMTDPEAVELLADGLQTQGAENVTVDEVKPFQFGRHPGFFARMSFQNKPGLHYRAVLVGETVDQTLSFALFYAPAEYFFPREEAAVQALFESIESLR